MLMASCFVFRSVPCWNQMHLCIFESLRLEGSYVGDLLYFIKKNLRQHFSLTRTRHSQEL